MGKIYQLKKLTQELNRFSNDVASGRFSNQFAHICVPLIVKDLDKIFKTNIDDYYKFPKKYYKRTKAFYKTYKIDGMGNTIRAFADASLMPKTHRVDKVDPDYIYEYMFAQGYHGGARSGDADMDGNPFPGGMALRTPIPQFSSDDTPPYSLWSLKQAGRSEEAPEKMIQDELNSYNAGGPNSSGSVLKDRVESSLTKVLKQYSFFN